MNAPLAELVRWRVLECAKHSARLRHALRKSAAYAYFPMRSLEPASWRILWAISPPERRAWRVKLMPSYWTIGPRGVLP